jgi:hypothetical protein
MIKVPIKPQPSSNCITGSFELTDTKAQKALVEHITSGKRIQLNAEIDEESGEILSIYFTAHTKQKEINEHEINNLRSLALLLHKHLEKI